MKAFAALLVAVALLGCGRKVQINKPVMKGPYGYVCSAKNRCYVAATDKPHANLGLKDIGCEVIYTADVLPIRGSSKKVYCEVTNWILYSVKISH